MDVGYVDAVPWRLVMQRFVMWRLVMWRLLIGGSLCEACYVEIGCVFLCSSPCKAAIMFGALSVVSDTFAKALAIPR